jgi:hypothetical protein
MTLDEYARETAELLRRAHNSKNLSDIAPILSGADKTLADNDISDVDRKAFWLSVKQYLESGNLLFERQANSSLVALMQAIQSAIAARTAKK